MKTETLVFLLKGGHINMPDRIAQGIWPHAPLRVSDLVRVITECLTTSEWFPDTWHPHQKGQPVNEWGVIHRLGPNNYVYRSQAADPLNPRVVTDSGEISFTSPEDAALHYLIWDLHLPGNLDGWKVVD